MSKTKTARDVPAWKTLWLLRRFMLPHHWAIVFGFLLIAAIAAMDLLKPWPLKFVLDKILGRPLEGSTLRLLVGVAAAIVAIAVLEGLCSYLLVLFLNRAGRTIVFELRTALFDHVQRLSLQFHSRRSTGDVLTRVTSDSKAVRDVLTESLSELMTSALFIVGMGVVLVWLDWQLALVGLGGFPLLLVALRHFSGRIREYSRAERHREGMLASIAHEALATVRLSRAFAREDQAKKRFEAESAASLESGFAAALAEERFGWLADVLAAVVAAAALAFGVYRVHQGAITAGTLVVFVSYIRGFYKPLRSGIKNANKISRAAGRVERILELLDVKEEVNDLDWAYQAPRLVGRVEFREVSFAYEPGQPVLEGVDLLVPERQFTALVGPTGAGKTTLVSLVPRLYDPSVGTVSIDTVDVRAFTLRSLRSQISMVLQESVLLSASVAENIKYGRPSASHAEVVAAATAANAHDFITALPDGYETELGERGETLSGGQRQRIAIARAIVRDTPIVILDEPLAGLDATSAAAVLGALEWLVEQKTLIVISHDLSLVQRADQIAVVDEGRVVEVGSHLELLNAGGLYRRLYDSRFSERVVS